MALEASPESRPEVVTVDHGPNSATIHTPKADFTILFMQHGGANRENQYESKSVKDITIAPESIDERFDAVGWETSTPFCRDDTASVLGSYSGSPYYDQSYASDIPVLLMTPYIVAPHQGDLRVTAEYAEAVAGLSLPFIVHYFRDREGQIRRKMAPSPQETPAERRVSGRRSFFKKTIGGVIVGTATAIGISPVASTYSCIGASATQWKPAQAAATHITHGSDALHRELDWIDPNRLVTDAIVAHKLQHLADNHYFEHGNRRPHFGYIAGTNHRDLASPDLWDRTFRQQLLLDHKKSIGDAIDLESISSIVVCPRSPDRHFVARIVAEKIVVPDLQDLALYAHGRQANYLHLQPGWDKLLSQAQ